MRLLPVLLLAVLTLALTAAPAGAKRSCGTVTEKYSYGSYTFRLYVNKGRVSCATARKVMKVVLVRNRTYKGWSCFNPPASLGVDKECGQPRDAREDFTRVITAKLRS